MYCVNCGQWVDSGNLFCGYCGTKMAQPMTIPMGIPVKKKRVRSNGKPGVIGFILGLLALIAGIVLVIICSKVGVKNTKILLLVAAAVAVIGIVCFVKSKKGNLAIAGFACSLLTILLVVGYLAIYLNSVKDRISKTFLSDLESCVDMTKDEKFDNYYEYYLTLDEWAPYKSLNDFYQVEQGCYSDVEDYLRGIYEDGDYEAWITSCDYVSHSLSENQKVFRNSNLMEEIWEDSADMNPADLKYFDILFENSEFGNIYSKSTDSIKEAITEASGGTWTYVLDYDTDTLSFRGFRNYFIVKNTAKETSYAVVSLYTGNYFVDGSWD